MLNIACFGFSWEAYATLVTNCTDAALVSTIQSIVKDEGIDLAKSAQVIIGRDTRPSSPALADSASAGVLALESSIVDCGIVTTPQLHYVVRCTNDSAYGVATERGYYEKVTAAFKELFISSGRRDPLHLQVRRYYSLCLPAPVSSILSSSYFYL